MPAKSKKQQMAAGAALSAKRGEMPKSSLKGASRSMVKSMSAGQLEELASTKRKKLPTKKNNSKSSNKRSSGSTKSSARKSGYGSKASGRKKS